MTKKKHQDSAPNDGSQLVRKVGEREETIEVPLTQEQLLAQKDLVCELIDAKGKLEDEKKEAMKALGARSAAIDLKLENAMRLVRARRQSVGVMIEDWLTKKNEIVRIRADTQEQIGDVRRARADELQERLFEDPPQNDASGHGPDPDLPSADEVFGDMPA